jgi:hypothetical protein
MRLVLVVVQFTVTYGRGIIDQDPAKKGLQVEFRVEDTP